MLLLIKELTAAWLLLTLGHRGSARFPIGTLALGPDVRPAAQPELSVLALPSELLRRYAVKVF